MTNREFRKIPSLDFMYEISEDGRIFRNVKSKKQLKIEDGPIGYHVYVSIKGQVLDVLVSDILREVDTTISQVIISKDQSQWTFPSIRSSASWLSQTLSKDPESIRSKMKKRRSHIYGFDVKYL